MRSNYKFKIKYDGTRFSGWEKQKNTDMTIQGKLEAVLSRMTGEEVTVIGAGRTDAGVSAMAMVANALLVTDKSDNEIMKYMNHYLPDDISIDEVKLASPKFHSRFNAVGKTYRYTCYVGETKPVFDRKYVTVLEKKPNILKMREASAKLIGTNDYKSFCGNKHFKKRSVRTVDSIEIIEKGPYIYFSFHGDGFLQNMVRIMTGTLLEVGYGKLSPDSMNDILDAKDRQKAGPMAPPEGLMLMSVDY